MLLEILSFQPMLKTMGVVALEQHPEHLIETLPLVRLSSCTCHCLGEDHPSWKQSPNLCTMSSRPSPTLVTDMKDLSSASLRYDGSSSHL